MDPSPDDGSPFAVEFEVEQRSREYAEAERRECRADVDDLAVRPALDQSVDCVSVIVLRDGRNPCRRSCDVLNFFILLSE